jgi:hypothetical protein
MNRRRIAVAALLGGFAIAALAACSTSEAGSGSTTESGSHGSAASTKSATTDATASTGSTSSTGSASSPGSTASGASNPTGTTTHPTTGTVAPANAPAVSFTYSCEITSYEDLPGLPHTALYSPIITWKVTNATGMALSIDNPGLVGSYGTYGPSGSMDLYGGCYSDEGTHTITAYTVGGTGPQAHQTITKTGTMTRPTAPSFATTTAPRPLPSSSHS